MCEMEKHPQGFFTFKKPIDRKVFDLAKPLLSHSWCAGFSFSKCHLEITTPYDVFIPQVFDAEEFTRFARFWTRGYDVYTPTQNIVFHNYGNYPEGVEPKGWPVNNKERLASLQRIKTLLMLSDGEGEEAHANLGLYGLGKRRSLKDLMTFSGIDLDNHLVKETNCGLHSWVPYDSSISPFENMISEAKNMDPQPEYPLRHALTAPFVQTLQDLNHHLQQDNADESLIASETDDDSIPIKSIFLFWILGLIIWYKTFVPPIPKKR